MGFTGLSTCETLLVAVTKHIFYFSPKIYFALIQIFFGISGDSPTTKRNSTWTDTLKRDLLVDYDKFVRPVDHGSTTKVHIFLTVKHVDVDEQKGIMSVFGWIKMVK